MTKKNILLINSLIILIIIFNEVNESSCCWLCGKKDCCDGGYVYF
ncbi:hypothetical protein Mgra_00007581 [Meloidogyne graminicola]|uniref:Uncharacterized protein n=1 Tax=Meloidogyne graminicola TaxID=189291 RepID=A0A8S9ZI45_9BILA|nr:hypothetical protein Mgra_00007581 [Meloidogyne graminicola]